LGSGVRIAVVPRLKGNCLRFGFSPKGLKPGDYALKVVA